MEPSVVTRSATFADERALEALVRRAACLYAAGPGLTGRALLAHSLVVTAWTRDRLQGCLSAGALQLSVAQVQTVAVRYREDVDRCLAPMVRSAEVQLRDQGAEALIYVGREPWLVAGLTRQGFHVAHVILIFRKQGWEIPDPGNQKVNIRPAKMEDIPVLVRLDEAAFREPLWRNGVDGFRTSLNRMSHAVVAEREGRLLGYQFSQIRGGEGYLARLAVCPAAQGHRIGVRLLADAVRFFQGQAVGEITLNTQGDNHRAQRLYRWFGFRAMGEDSVVLEKNIGQRN